MPGLLLATIPIWDGDGQKKKKKKKKGKNV
jgi:hypothetical protein